MSEPGTRWSHLPVRDGYWVMVIHAPAPTRTVTLTIDGAAVTVPEGTTIWAAARQAGIEIPVLCHDERYDPVGVCRMCVVDVGARAYAAACVRPCEDSMEVKTATPDVERSRATLTELLLSDQPAAGQDPKQTTTADNELLVLAEHFGLSGEVQRDGGPALPDGSGRGTTCPTRSSPSTTTRASCATAASAPATTSRATTSSAAAARDTAPGSRSTWTTRWARRRA